MTVMVGCGAVPMAVTMRSGPGREQTSSFGWRSGLRRAGRLHFRDKKRCYCQKENTQDAFPGNSPKTGDSPRGY